MAFAERWQRRERLRRARRYLTILAALCALAFAGRLIAQRYGHTIARAAKAAFATPALLPRVDSGSLTLPPSQPPQMNESTKTNPLRFVEPLSAKNPDEDVANSPPKKPRFILAKNWIPLPGFSITRTSKGALRQFDDIPFHPFQRKPKPKPPNGVSIPPASTAWSGATAEDDGDSNSAASTPGMAPLLGGRLTQREVDKFRTEHIDKDQQERLQQEWLAQAERERKIRAFLMDFVIGMGIVAVGYLAIVFLSGLWKVYLKN